jgi:GNAT superfamily N-acetyltransferase
VTGNAARGDPEVVDADLSDPVHCDAVVQLLDSYSSDPMGAGRGLTPEVRARLLPGLREHPGSVVLLAFVAGQPVGIAVCFRGFSTFHARPLVNIHDLAVLPDWRGKGVGRALLAAVESRARAWGCCRLTLEVLDENARARRLYESVGFSDPTTGRMGFLMKSLDG